VEVVFDEVFAGAGILMKMGFLREKEGLGILLGRFRPFLVREKPLLGAEKPLNGREMALFGRVLTFWRVLNVLIFMFTCV
jgi:hypothetical protein